MTLTLEIPDDLYQPLARRAKREGTTPERIALDSIVGANRGPFSMKTPIVDDPILDLLGAFRSDLVDIGERHDDYIGQSFTVSPSENND